RDFRGISQITNTRLDNVDAGDVKSVPEIRLQRFVHFVMTGTQSHFRVSVKIVVRIHPCKAPYRCITLNPNEVFIIINFKRCLERIAHLPYQDYTDLYRVTYLVVYFDFLAVEVAGPQ